MREKSEVRAAWVEGNNDGLGFRVPDEHAGSISEVFAYLARDGGRVLEVSTDDDGISLVRTAEGDLIGVGTANGPWCVRLPRRFMSPPERCGGPGTDF